MTARLAIFALTYLLLAAQRVPWLRVDRPGAALIGAVAMITVGGLPLSDAYAAIDLDVLVFLFGVMLLTAYLEAGHFFDWAAARVVAHTRSARALLAAVVAVSGALSALFVNDTVCLVLTPLIIAAVRPLGLRPVPYLLALALAANAGSVVTLTGNPQNMLIGVASGLSFARFAASQLAVGAGALVIIYAVLVLRYRRELAVPLAASHPVPAVALDVPLVARAVVVFAGALVAWLAGYSLPLVAIVAAGILVAIARRPPALAYARIEWPLLVFFAALFVLLRGVRDLPPVVALTTAAAAQLTGAPWRDAGIVSGAMVVLSNLVSNVPAVLLWLPVVPRLPDAGFIWLVVAMSATFAGNLTLLGSLANLIVAERAEARGVTLRFTEYLGVGVPVTLLTVAWGIAALVALRR